MTNVWVTDFNSQKMAKAGRMLSVMQVLTRLSALVMVMLCTNVLANPNLLNPSNAENAAKLELLKSVGGKNEIRLLNNRFRVDYEVEEVMMIFFRKRGSSPIVLVRPDGSKLYPKDANGNELEWHADISYDLIKLKSPMPGPWQAVGRILPDSKIMIISDIELEADLLPPVVFQYEKIKAEARVINAEKMVREKNFRSVVSLKASLYPSSDSSQDNFGSDIHQFGEFLDNGKGLDERPRDGVFTIEYDLSVGNGEWLPKYWLNTELFSRELTQPPITVLPSPISYQETQAAEDGRYHYITISVDDSLIENDSMVFNGEIRFPNGDIQTFSIEDQQSRQLKIFNSEYGTYTVTTQAFGTTFEGREFVMTIPPYQMLVQAPIVESIQDIELPEMIDMTEPEMIQDKAPEPEFPVALVVLVNVLILIIGFLVIWLFVLKRDIPNPFARFLKKKAKQEEEIAPLPEQEKPAKKAEERQESDDILDLSLPED